LKNNHILFMKKLVLLSLIIYTLLFVGLATFNGVVLVLAIPLILYLGAGLLYRPPKLQLEVLRNLSAERISENQPVDVKLTITNRGGPLEAVLFEELLPDSLNVQDGETRLLTPLPTGATVELNYTVTGTRGPHRIAGVRATANDTFGLFQRQTVITVFSDVMILPEVIRLRRAEIRPKQTRVYSGPIPTRQGGSGVEFFGVREYQPGDPLRWVNSRASARHSESLFINEFQQERVADVGLILDAREQSDVLAGEDSLFEHSVRATASLADVFLNAGNRVGLFIYGRALDWTFPGYGKIQRERILRALAAAKLGGGQVFEKLDYLPTRLFPARSQIVFISPLLPQDPEELTKLCARGYRLLIISPDPVSFEQQTLANTEEVELGTRLARLEREVLLNQLRYAGIQVMDWPVDTPFQQAAHLALSRIHR
jgi:uncharacterized protein (DUF58 family)